MNKLFCDLKTDEEKAAFFLSGRGFETGIIAQAIQNDVAMAYHRCAEYKKELAQLRAQPERVPLTREQVNAIAKESGYLNGDPENLCDFINGIRHGESAHGIQPAHKEQS